jgi:hypothetical protein
LEEKEVKKESKFKRGCLGCLSWFSVVVGILLLLWFIFIQKQFIFIRYEIHGRIIDRETKKPIENALVVFAWRDKATGWREYDATITDKKGYYRLPKRFIITTGRMGEWGILEVILAERDGCVLVAWFPGYFRSEKWESGRALIKGKQDFALQKAKTREEVVRSLEIGADKIEFVPDLSDRSYKTDTKRFYNPTNVEVKEYYRKEIEKLFLEFSIPQIYKNVVKYY